MCAEELRDLGLAEPRVAGARHAPVGRDGEGLPAQQHAPARAAPARGDHERPPAHAPRLLQDLHRRRGHLQVRRALLFASPALSLLTT